MSTITGRKIRADAKLELLNEAQRERLHFWFEENCTYREVVDLVRKEFGLSVGKSAVSAYYRRHVLSLQQEDETEVVATFAALPAGDFDTATPQRAKALLWSALAQIHPDVDLAAKLSGIIEKAERRGLAVRKLALEERKVAVKEQLAAERAAAAERRRETTEAEVKTTKHTKRHETGGESAGAIGRSEGAEVAAKALSREGRSEGAESGKLENREIGKVENRSELKNERPNLPRFSGYSEVGRGESEAEVARELRELARMERQEGESRHARKDANGAATEKMEEENREIEKHGETDKVGASAEVVKRGAVGEVPAKAPSREDRSDGAEGFRGISVSGGGERETEQRMSKAERPALKDGEGGASGVGSLRAAVAEAARSVRLSEAELPPLMPGFRRSVGVR